MEDTLPKEIEKVRIMPQLSPEKVTFVVTFIVILLLFGGVIFIAAKSGTGTDTETSVAGISDSQFGTLPNKNSDASVPYGPYGRPQTALSPSPTTSPNTSPTPTPSAPTPTSTPQPTATPAPTTQPAAPTPTPTAQPTPTPQDPTEIPTPLPDETPDE